jgi:hypothetical protein
MSKKYHEQHPTISFRCRSLQEYNKIKRMVQISGKSESTFIREILLEEERKESKSYEAGRLQEMNKFYLACSICKKSMVFDLNTDTEAINKILEIFGNYAHVECVKKKQQQNPD